MKKSIPYLVVGMFALGPITNARAQYGDLGDLQIAKPGDLQHVKRRPAPRGAAVLFDGKSLGSWERRDGKGAAAWDLVDGGAMQVAKGTGDIVTKDKFAGSFHLHVEFRVPFMPDAKGQGRGNSGVYLQGRYEVQVLDSYGLKSQDNDCGGIYKVAAPRVNACKAPTIWQSYDIYFHAPECVDGKKAKPARISVIHNGIEIHKDVVINSDNTTGGMAGDPCTPGPILLQDHGNPVQYRNIWIRSLSSSRSDSIEESESRPRLLERRPNLLRRLLQRGG